MSLSFKRICTLDPSDNVVAYWSRRSRFESQLCRGMFPYWRIILRYLRTGCLCFNVHCTYSFLFFSEASAICRPQVMGGPRVLSVFLHVANKISNLHIAVIDVKKKNEFLIPHSWSIKFFIHQNIAKKVIQISMTLNEYAVLDN